MFGPNKKHLATRLARQLTGYHLIRSDLEYSSYLFFEASKLPTAKEEPYVLINDEQMRAFAAQQVSTAATEKIAMGTLTPPHRGAHTVRNALFEAGIMAYARCFNSGTRTGLNDKIFRDQLAGGKDLHSWIMRVRNRHIGHAELRLEKSLVGIQLVDDPYFGPRPSVLMTLFSVHRDAPSDGKMVELSQHSAKVIECCIDPRLKKMVNEAREQLLRMPREQIEALEEFDKAMRVISHDLGYENI